MARGVGQGHYKGNKSVEGGSGQDSTKTMGGKNPQTAKYVPVGRPYGLPHAALLYVDLLSLTVSSKGMGCHSTASALLAQDVPKATSRTTALHTSSELPGPVSLLSP